MNRLQGLGKVKTSLLYQAAWGSSCVSYQAKISLNWSGHFRSLRLFLILESKNIMGKWKSLFEVDLCQLLGGAWSRTTGGVEDNQCNQGERVYFWWKWKWEMSNYLNLIQSYPEKMGAKGYIAHMRLLNRNTPSGTSGPSERVVSVKFLG